MEDSIEVCVLRAFGEDFDVDEFVTGTVLKPYEIYHRGELRFPKSKRKQDTNDHSGLKIKISDKNWDNLTGQIEDAVDYLATNFDSLKELVGFPNVEDVTLDFPLDLRIDGKKILGQYDYLPPSLITLAGSLGIGIELSMYTTEKSI